MRRFLAFVTVLAITVFTGCASRPAGFDRAAVASRSSQLVLVTTTDWDSPQARLRSFQRDGSRWREVGTEQAVMIGRAGSAWGLGLHPAQADGPLKREGDGRSPAGMFAIGTAFGYADSAATRLPYGAMKTSHYCVDVSGSPLYNRIVDASETGEAAVAGSTEPMRRDLHADGDPRYRLGFLIEHNTEGRPMGGSCIFAHLWRAASESTSGCTAMAPEVMDRLLAWLRPESRPLFVLLPYDQYVRLHAAWGLPPPGAHP